MTPDNLRKLSWQTFKATIICGVIGALLVVAIPKPGFADASDILVRILAISAFGLVVIAVLADIVSLISGAVAWAKGSKSCAWIFICAILLLIPISVLTAVLMGQ
jgi:hypothetical protein